MQMHSAHRSFFWLVCMLASIQSITAQQSCAAGQADYGSGCQACPRASYKSAAGTHGCTPCNSKKNVPNEPNDGILEVYTLRLVDLTAAEIRTGPASWVPPWRGLISDNYVTGATSASGCQCAGGFTGSSGICSACGEGLGNQYNYGGTAPCNTCPVNLVTKYWPAVGNVDVCVCKPGYTGSSGNWLNCVQCAAGKYKNWVSFDYGSNIPNDGEPNFNDRKYLNPCTPCPQYSTHNILGSTTMNDCICNTGYVRSSDWIANQWADPAYFSASLYSKGTCIPDIPCPVGQTGSAGVCTPCATGKYKAVTGSAACDQCAVGKSQNNAGSTQCRNCDAGYYAALTGSTACAACSAGKYAVSTGSSVCTDCPAGKWSPDIAVVTAGNCYGCEINSFSLSGSTAQSNCKCNAGYTGPDGPSWSGACAACVAGKYKTSSGSAACIDCLASSYAALTGSTSCVACDTGKFSSATGQSSSATCQSCLAGKYILPGSNVCENCLAGKYSTASGQSSSATCQNCAEGKFSASTGQSSSATCQNCSVGTYSNTTGMSSSATCQNCAAGKFSTLTGQSSASTCQNCDAGKYSTATGQSSSATCQNCTAGTYGNLPGSTACTLCPVLTTSAAGSSMVTQCTSPSARVTLATQGQTEARAQLVFWERVLTRRVKTAWLERMVA